MFILHTQLVIFGNEIRYLPLAHRSAQPARTSA
jgi:hypothetical protein